MAPSLRDAVRLETMTVLQLAEGVPRSERCLKRKLVDHLFNPCTFRQSVDKLPHEVSGKKGQKRGGHYFWLIRQVRRWAEATTPSWYALLSCKRETYDTSCVREHANEILSSFPRYDCGHGHDTAAQSDAFKSFDRRMTKRRAVISCGAANGPAKSRRPCRKTPFARPASPDVQPIRAGPLHASRARVEWAQGLCALADAASTRERVAPQALQG